MSSETPPAAAAGPSPAERIGKLFIKQYYKTLLTSPSMLNRFYQPTSCVSRGMEPNSPAMQSLISDAQAAATENGIEEDPGERVRHAFFDWAGVGTETETVDDNMNILRIDFERGAIDAQESVGGGILVVVTAHMFMPKSEHPLKPVPFVHTFFLDNSAAPGKKKQFYVKNDILRFLLPVEDEPVVSDGKIGEATQTETEVADVAAVVVEDEVVLEEPAIQAEPEVVEEPIEVPAETADYVEDYDAPAAEEEKYEIVDEYVEETLAVEDEPAAEEEKISITESPSTDSPTASPSSDSKRSKRNRRKIGGKSSRSNSPGSSKEDTPEKPKAPSSWANLVASGATKKSEEASGSGKKGRRGSPKAQRDGGKSSTNADAQAKAPPQSQQPRSGDRAPTKESAPSASSSTSATAAPTAAATQSQSNQRNPKATIFIRNIPDPTKESEVRALFEPHAVTAGSKILGVTLNANRGFCFVDFDGSLAVDAVIEEAGKSLVKDQRTGRKVTSSFVLHGRVLDVERKVRNDPKQGGGGSGGFNRNRNSRGRSGMRRSPPRGGGGGNSR